MRGKATYLRTAAAKKKIAGSPNDMIYARIAQICANSSEHVSASM